VNQPVSNLEQIYCKQQRGSSDNSNITYKLSALLKDGRSVDLLSHLDDPDIAFFIEQQIETWLNIPDRHVHGEMAG
jgi:hypothetical protein